MKGVSMSQKNQELYQIYQEVFLGKLTIKEFSILIEKS